ncbi:MAG: GNAT family N-acetyltransferase [Thermoplasmatota archaeon]
MKYDDYLIKIINSWDTDEIVRLYKAGGWWKDTYDPSLIPGLISGSFVFAVVVDSKTEKAIGMGRVISDGVSDAYIQDLVVLPGSRDKGIGTNLVSVLIQECLKKNISWIGLIAQPGSFSLYSRLGFKPMKDHIPLLYHRVD